MIDEEHQCYECGEQIEAEEFDEDIPYCDQCLGVQIIPTGLNRPVPFTP